MNPIIRPVAMLTLAALPLQIFAEIFPGPPLDTEYAAQIAAADDALEAEDFTTAFAMYLNDLAPMGDKFAQHQVGVMLINGIGTAPDLTLGAAWLDLSSERGDESLRKYRNEVWKQLGPDAKSAAREDLTEIEPVYGDCAIVQKLADEDQEALSSLTGTRIESNDMMPLSIIGTRPSGGTGGDPVGQRKDLKLRKEFLRDHCR